MSNWKKYLPRREYATVSALIVVLILGALWARSPLADPPLLGQAILVLLAAIGAYGLNLITGYAGQASIGNAGFMAIGAMTAWYVGNNLGQGFVGSVVLGGLGGVVVGAVVGAVALRWRGFYLVLATLAVQFIVVFLIRQEQLTGPIERQAGFTFQAPEIGGKLLLFDKDWFVLIAVVLAVIMLVIAGLVNSPTGRAWIALRENEGAASVAGVNVVWVKILAFSIGSGVISLGGALAGYYAGAVGYESYPLSVAVLYVAMIIIGGVGSMAGPFLGACMVTLIPYLVADLTQTEFGATIVNLNGAGGLPYVQAIVYCVIVLLFLAIEPRGMAALGGRLVHLLRKLGSRTTAPDPPTVDPPYDAPKTVEEVSR